MILRCTLLTLVISVLSLLAAAPGSAPGRADASSSDAGKLTGVAAITAGGRHTCALTEGGAVQCWGRNTNGELGAGMTSYTALSTPVAVLGLQSGVAAITAGSSHTCAVTTGGGLQCWGSSKLGRLGNGNTTTLPSPTPTDVVGLASGVATGAAGKSHTCAVTTEGVLKCWGFNTLGKVGDGSSLNNRSTPVDVVGLAGKAAAAALGNAHTCGLTVAGGVQCWGFNEFGELGNGTTSGREPNPTPVDVVGLESGVVSIAAGAATCALTAEGGVKCWGSNRYGQLGAVTAETCVATFPEGEIVPCSTVPIDVTGLTSGVAAIAAGGYHTCAVTTVGGLKCWGRNQFGQLGDGTTTDSPIPADVVGLESGVAAVAAGGEHTCALMTAGSVKCWGSNRFRQLADGTTGGIRTTPVDVLVDSDSDGCTDVQEAGLSAGLGGLRDPENYWDFFNTPDVNNIRDRQIDITDIGNLVARFGALGEPEGDPLSPPPYAPAYHTAFDRGGPIPGENLWNLLPANGSIDIIDIGAMIIQFGHTCA